jgi:hypothetical protein
MSPAELRKTKHKTARLITKRGTRTTIIKGPTVSSVMKTISDPISLGLFKSISEAGIDSSNLRNKTRLSRRQYYSRLYGFTRNGILIKKNGKNYRTAFGGIIYHTLMTVENAFVNNYKLKAIDSIGLYHDIPQEEYNKIIDTLITDPYLREILYSRKDAVKMTMKQRT